MSRLELRGLKTYFFVNEGIVKAVDGVDLTVNERESVGVIGESGSGKTAMAQSLLRLVPKPGEIVQGKATLHCKDGRQMDIFALEPNSAELKGIRGGEIGIVFQEPKMSFSPVHTIGTQISEMVRAHTSMSRREVRDYVIDLLNRVEISNPRQRFEEYPHQLSGGMAQRAMIAMALSCKPSLLIADEATTALDVTIQAQILELLKRLEEEEGLSAIYITHNLGVVAEQVDRVYVMYLGRVVETATTERLFASPMHPYTQKLLLSAPRPGQRTKRLEAIEGSVPSPIGRPVQCGFYSRCPSRLPKCGQTIPALIEVEEGHEVRCFLYNEQEEPEDDWTFVGAP
jgi:oligopeptide/dipeptide ABC transporter ATP-binding protein